MTTVEFKIKVKANNLFKYASFKLTRIENGQTLVEYECEGDYFKDADAHTHTAFNRIREKINSKDEWFMIKGCRRDVHPSGRMLTWIYAYKLTIGKRVNDVEDKVMIFEEEEDYNSIVTVHEQKEFYKDWLDSIKGLPY